MNFTTITLKLTDEQKQELIQQLTLELFPSPKKPKRFKHMREKTKKFIMELEELYGNNWINRKDKILQDLMYKHRVTDIAYILKNINAEVRYKGLNTTHGSLRISMFKINN